ncbi:AI-2E family transporter [Ensifer soli]|uniref:AI-2E family transporter n=1 Tax=Ciceribacter sp. sgz301302 TaxID=3342379 RepID=UPI0035B7DFD6
MLEINLTRSRGARTEPPATDPATPATPRVYEPLTLVCAVSIIGLFIIAAAAVVSLMEPILMPITLAIVVGIVLGEAADTLGKLGVPPMLGGLIVAAIFVAGLFWLANTLAEPLSQLAAAAPRMIEDVLSRIMPFLERFEFLRVSAGNGDQGEAIRGMVMENSGVVLGIVAAGLTPALVQTAVFIAALGLFLVGRAELRKTIIMAFTIRERRLTAIRVMNAIEHSLAFYFSMASLIYLCLGVVTMVIAFAGGLSMAPLWGFFAFISSFVPFLGVTLMTLALAAAGLLTHDGLVLALAPATGFFLLHLVMENLVTPSILGRRLEVNPFLIFVAIIFWTWMWGAVGAMLALPLSLIAMTLVDELRTHPPERQLPG